MWKIAVFLGIFAFVKGDIYSELTKFLGHETPTPTDEYWGPSEQPKINDDAIRLFNVEFNDSMVQDLKLRLKNTRFPQPSIENSSWTYGINSEFIPTIVDYWMSKYDFKKQEKLLNRYPQFLTNIQGLDIHFYHVKPTLPEKSKIKVLPLLIVHGWPGSVVEFQKIIPLLTTPRQEYDFVFELIIPSLPGYAFSTAPTKPGVGPVAVANIMKNLMLRLGFQKFYTQGGDWGLVVTGMMASLFPDSVLGMHSNLCFVLRPLSLLKYVTKIAVVQLDPRYSEYSILNFISMLFQNTGYFHYQGTTPDRLAVPMHDSPSGLAAYILSMFVGATFKGPVRNKDGNLTDKFIWDELLDNVMLYWVPNTASSSMRLYKEFLRSDNIKYEVVGLPIKVPSACAQFPNEIITFPEEILRDRYVNLVHLSKPPRGGHFAAMEEPQLLADDVYLAVDKMRKDTFFG